MYVTVEYTQVFILKSVRVTESGDMPVSLRRSPGMTGELGKARRHDWRSSQSAVSINFVLHLNVL